MNTVLQHSRSAVVSTGNLSSNASPWRQPLAVSLAWSRQHNPHGPTMVPGQSGLIGAPDLVICLLSLISNHAVLTLAARAADSSLTCGSMSLPARCARFTFASSARFLPITFIVSNCIDDSSLLTARILDSIRLPFSTCSLSISILAFFFCNCRIHISTMPAGRREPPVSRGMQSARQARTLLIPTRLVV